MAVVKKNRKAYGYDYADLPSILLYVDETLHLEVRQHVVYDVAPHFPYGCVVTSIRQKAGEWSDWLAPIPVLVGDETEGGNQKRKNTLAQRYGSAETYARRYSLNTALGLSSTDDDAQTSGFQKRSVKFMTDEQKTQIDRILEDCKIPVGQENGFIGTVLQTRVAYGTLTEYQAQRFIDAYRQHNDKVKEAPSEQ